MGQKENPRLNHPRKNFPLNEILFIMQEVRLLEVPASLAAFLPKSQLAFWQEDPGVSVLMDTWKITLKNMWETMSFASPCVLKKSSSNHLQHLTQTRRQWLVMYMMEKNHLKRVVNLDSSLHDYCNVNSTLRESKLCRKCRDTAITNVKISYQCVSAGISCAQKDQNHQMLLLSGTPQSGPFLSM